LCGGSDERVARGCERNEWLGVEIRHLAALAAIARHGSFRAAAHSLGYVPSAVSQQIAYLERAVGMRLIERSRGSGPIEVTEAGRVLLGHTEDIASRLGAAQADLQALSEGLAGNVRLGVHESVAKRLMPALIDRFAADRPGVRLTMHEASTDSELFELVERGELDVSFADLPLEPGPFEASELLEDPYVLVVASDSAVARRGSVQSLGDIDRLRLISRSRCRHWERLEAQLRANAVGPESVFHSDISTTVQALVRNGVAAAILPSLGVDEHDPGIATIDIGHLLGRRRLVLFWHAARSHTEALLHLAAIARSVCGELAATRPGLCVTGQADTT
jgi:DNA-binding transcriptional LysR family regulator